MDDPHQQLMRLAAAAVRHAKRQHGVELSPQDLDAIDTILSRSRTGPQDAGSTPRASEHAGTVAELSAWYGAWIGYWAVTTCGGEWAGLHEPCAPRVRVGGEYFSPVDGIRRIVQGDPGAIPIAAIARRMRRASRDANSSRDTWLTGNREAWETLARDRRFGGVGTLPDSPERALAAIDPWLRESIGRHQRLDGWRRQRSHGAGAATVVDARGRRETGSQEVRHRRTDRVKS